MKSQLNHIKVALNHHFPMAHLIFHTVKSIPSGPQHLRFRSTDPIWDTGAGLRNV